MKLSWRRGRGRNSLRGEIKLSLKRNKHYLNRRVRHQSTLKSGGMYKKFAKERAYDCVS